jgi:hypothetical protein
MRFARFGALSCFSWLTLVLAAQQTKIEEAWDSILTDAQAAPSSRFESAPFRAATARERFFFETRTEYTRYSTAFTGLPTITGVINAPFTGVFNPNGIPYPDAFQPAANRLYSFLDFGTRGWLSDRVNTHFAVRYEQDLTHVVTGAPAQGMLETFGGARRIDLLNASVEIAGRSGGSPWELELGRQYVYGAELAAIDGASFTINTHPFALTLFGGRRFTFFGDPDQRAIGGANVTFRLGRSGSVEYQTLWYIRGENSIAWRQRVGAAWLLSSYFRAYGGAPVDFAAQGIYGSRGGKTSVRLGFLQKLTNRDYTYDYTIAAVSQSRLYLGPISPYTQFTIEADRSLTSALRLGAALWVRRLVDNFDQGPFDTSFQDYRVHANLFPLRFEYHQHDSNRLAPVNATTFDDVSRSGETSVKDLTGEIRRTFGEGRLSLSGGAYYRRLDMQDRFFVMNGLHQSGWLAGGWWRLDRRTRIYADYNLDNDFFLFYPSIKNSRALRLGVRWKY